MLDTTRKVDLLCAGWDEKNGPQMFFLDYLASMGEVKRAAHGSALRTLDSERGHPVFLFGDLSQEVYIAFL